MAFARSLVKCALLAAFVSLSLGNKKVSEIGVEGESVLMTCDLPKADPPIVEWKDWVNNPGRIAMEIADKDGNINPSHPYKDNFEVDIVKHQLTIKKFKKEDAGNYICESKVNASTTLVKTIILNFVGTLHCAGKTDLKENDKSDLICEVAYQGSQLPRPEWLSPDVSEGLDYETRDELLIARQAVVFTAKPDMNDAKFTCQITVGKKVLTKTCHKTLSVLYAVNAVEIEPEQAQYHAGDKVRCTANGNPPPKVMWKPAVKGAETGEGYSVMTVPAPTEEDPKEVTYTCSASSHIGGKVEIVDKSITFSILGTKQPKPDVDKEPKPSTGGAGVAGLVVGLIVGLLILVIIIVAVVCVLRGRRSKQPKGSKPVPTSDTEYGPEMDGKGANSNNVKYEDVEKQPAETPENHLLTSEDPKEKNVEGLDYVDLQFDENMELTPIPPLSSSDEITYVKV